MGWGIWFAPCSLRPTIDRARSIATKTQVSRVGSHPSRPGAGREQTRRGPESTSEESSKDLREGPLIRSRFADVVAIRNPCGKKEHAKSTTGAYLGYQEHCTVLLITRYVAKRSSDRGRICWVFAFLMLEPHTHTRIIPESCHDGWSTHIRARRTCAAQRTYGLHTQKGSTRIRAQQTGLGRFLIFANSNTRFLPVVPLSGDAVPWICKG